MFPSMTTSRPNHRFPLRALCVLGGLITLGASPAKAEDDKNFFSKLGFTDLALFDNVADAGKEVVPTKPASAAFFFPDGGDKYYSVDAGLAATGKVPGLDWLAETLSVAVHRNTTTTDYAHSLVATYGVNTVFGKIGDPIVAYTALDIPYKDDRKKGERSFVPKLTAIPGAGDGGLFAGPLALFNAAKIIPLGGPSLGLRPVLTLGVEREDIIHSTTAKRPLGHAWRGITKYQWEITGADKTPDKDGKQVDNIWSRVVLSIAASTWYDFDRSGSLGTGTHTHRNYEETLTFYWDATKVFGFQFKRFDGEDLDQGKPVQHLTQAGIVVKWGKK